MRSLRSGLLSGYTSASMDTRSEGSASGNWPSTAWEPITTMSGSSAMVPAARIMCSKFERVIDVPAFPRIEHAGERGGLAQLRHARTVLCYQLENLRQRTAENFAPRIQIWLRPAALSRPAFDIFPCDLEQVRALAKLRRDRPMQGETPAFNALMRHIPMLAQRVAAAAKESLADQVRWIF